MKESDDILIRQFFDEHKETVADHGFSRRVMHRLPGHSVRRMERIWTACCTAGAVALFVALDGFGLLWNALREVCLHMMAQGTAQTLDMETYAVVVLVLLSLLYHKLAQQA